MTKEEILKNVANVEETNAQNIMGCSENWYNPYYALRETFGTDKLEEMTEKELNNLITLAMNITEYLY